MTNTQFEHGFDPVDRASLDKRFSEGLKEKLIEAALFACGLVSILATFGIVAIIFQVTFEFFQQVSLEEFFLDTKWTPLFAEQHFGVWPLINGTFLTTAIAMTVAVPLGLASAIYLAEGSAIDLLLVPKLVRQTQID
jgi:phosphate transport system permease protein